MTSGAGQDVRPAPCCAHRRTCSLSTSSTTICAPSSASSTSMASNAVPMHPGTFFFTLAPTKAPAARPRAIRQPRRRRSEPGSSFSVPCPARSRFPLAAQPTATRGGGAAALAPLPSRCCPQRRTAASARRCRPAPSRLAALSVRRRTGTQARSHHEILSPDVHAKRHAQPQGHQAGNADQEA